MKGIDLCYRQGNVDWKKLKAQGIDFVIPRSGWGKDCDGKQADPAFYTNVSGALQAKISVPGVYHFVYAVNETEARNNALCAVSAVQKAGLPRSTVIWCDIEYDTVDNARDYRGVNLTNEQLRAMAEAFCDCCLEQGYCTGVYVNRDYLCNVFGKDIADKYDIWLADLEGEPDFPCLIQQHEWRGRFDGMTEEVDVDRWIGTYTAGTAKPKNTETETKPQQTEDKTMIVYTEKELVDILIKLASGNPPSSYSNKPPKNLLYWDGSRWWADCSNLYKALFNGRSIENPKKDSYQYDLSNTGDCTERQLMNQCTDRSDNFQALGTRFRCLYMDGHFGGYLGKELNIDGQGIVNCVESTPRWEDGIQYSYVDEYGGRHWAKGEPAEGFWTEHGLATKWIDYTDGEDPKPSPEPQRKEMNRDVFVGFLPLLSSGANSDYVTLMQKCLRYTGDYADTLDGSFGPNTLKAVKAYQQNHGIYADGICGPKTWTALIG